MASGADIDADAIARWSLASFLSYLFGLEEWKPEYECLVQASWEWRKVGGFEAGCGGRGHPSCVNVLLVYTGMLPEPLATHCTPAGPLLLL